MSKTIWKAILDPTDVQEIEVPRGAEFLTAREQMERICVWFRCDPDQPKVKRKIGMAVTGGPAPSAEEGRYLGTAFLHGGQLACHVFEQA